MHFSIDGNQYNQIRKSYSINQSRNSDHKVFQYDEVNKMISRQKLISYTTQQSMPNVYKLEI